jgi:hypothetical protein
MPLDPNLLRSALFVDFDNIYSGLRELDARAAERFATNPQSWVDWMMLGLPGPEGRDGASASRAILIRRCYLNPERFQRHRADFTRAGFEVVDCPPLTRQGKTSTDIRMVMDILDTLRHETHFHEFILLSSDADFTPVLLRLRSMDRRTLVLTVGPAARAYRSACEQVIDEVFFIEAGLGVSADSAERAPERGPHIEAPGGSDPDLLRRMAERLHAEVVARPGGEMLAADVPPVYKRFPEFTAQNDWLGFFGLRPLTAHLIGLRAGLRIVDEPESAWKWKLVALPEGAEGGERLEPAPDVEGLRARIAALVLEQVRESARPLDLASAANAVQQRLGSVVRESNWAGAGSFSALLRRLELPGVAIDPPSADGPGALFDPERFQPRQAPAPDGFERGHPEVAALSLRISQVTGTPRLTPTEYASVFRAIAEELARAPFNLTLTSKAVRDRCAEAGSAVSRSDVVFILRGIQFSGLRFGARAEAMTDAELAAAFARNVLVLCRDAQMDLSEQEQDGVSRWIEGAPRAASASPDPSVSQIEAGAPGGEASGEAPVAVANTEAVALGD